MISCREECVTETQDILRGAKEEHAIIKSSMDGGLTTEDRYP